MTFAMRKSLLTLTLLLVLALAAVPVEAGSVNKSVEVRAGEVTDEASSVNGSVTVEEGATVRGEVSTVNGKIRIHDDAEVGDVSTVNGAVRVGSGVRARSLSTVNGAIRVDGETTIDESVDAVNGRIELEPGTTVGRHVENVNGEIELRGAEVGGDLTTVNGDVALLEESLLAGDLVVRKPQGWNWGFRKHRVPDVVVGPGSRVLGTIRLEREVNLFISDTAEVSGVEGELSLEDAERFSGDSP